jgi:hypothetical protein
MAGWVRVLGAITDYVSLEICVYTNGHIKHNRVRQNIETFKM